MRIKITDIGYYGRPKAIDVDTGKDASKYLLDTFSGFADGFKEISIIVPYDVRHPAGHGEPSYTGTAFKVIHPKTLETTDLQIVKDLVIDIYQIAPRGE